MLFLGLPIVHKISLCRVSSSKVLLRMYALCRYFRTLLCFGPRVTISRSSEIRFSVRYFCRLWRHLSTTVFVLLCRFSVRYFRRFWRHLPTTVFVHRLNFMFVTFFRRSLKIDPIFSNTELHVRQVYSSWLDYGTSLWLWYFKYTWINITLT